MPRPSRRADGFTLVELLVAMAILGIISAAIVTFSTGFLAYTGRVSAINDRLAELNDAAGYVATNGRRAVEVFGGTTTVDITWSGDTFTCSTSAAEPCIAFLVAHVDRASAIAAVDTYELLAYRVVPISDWAGNPGLASGWNGEDTPVMLEYRFVACSTGCASVPAIASPVTASRVSLVVPDLRLEDAAGAAIAPFTSTGVDEFTLRLRSGGRFDDSPLVPSDGPLEIAVKARP